jgi:ABC-2 type transport system ATP-binding protein
MNLVSVSYLRKTFGATVAVDDVNLSIEVGQIYGLVGSDGAGKTTTLRLIVGALKPNAGEIVVCGYDVQKQGEDARTNIGYLSQRFSLYEDLTVLENIRFFAELRGLKRDEWLPRCMEILEFVGLAKFKDRRAGLLSGGMKQKLGLASALVSRPKVLLLDEPTTGVDPVTRQDFWQLVIKIVSLTPNPSPEFGRGEAPNMRAGGKGVSVILTTPYMDEASRCHRIGFMRGGRIIAEGAPSQLRATLEGRIVEVRGPSLNEMRQSVKKMDGVEDARLFGDKLHLRVQPGAADLVIAAISSSRGSIPVEARLVSPTLEDVFIALSESNS